MCEWDYLSESEHEEDIIPETSVEVTQGYDTTIGVQILRPL